MTIEVLNQMVNKAEAENLNTKAYPKTWLINCEDCDGTIQSYYASTGTAIFRDGNGRNAARVTVKGMSFDRFIELCVGKEADILAIYF